MIGDLLSAESLLLAILAVIYGLWYSEISETLEIKPALHLEDSVGDLRRVKEVIRHRALPLAGTSFVVAIVFVPDVVRILVDAIRHVASHGWAAFGDYDAVKTAFVLVTVLTGALCVHVSLLAWSLERLRRRLTPQSN